MTREAKIGMLTGLGVIVLIGVLLSSYLGGANGGGMLAGATRMAALPAGEAYRQQLMQPMGVPAPPPGAPKMLANGAEVASPIDTTNGMAPLPLMVADAAPVVGPTVAPLRATPAVVPQDLSGPPTIALADPRQMIDARLARALPAVSPPTMTSVTYEILPGDNLAKIARKFYNSSKNSDVARLVKANPDQLKDVSSTLIAGKKLTIPNVQAAAPVATVKPVSAKVDGNKGTVIVPMPGDGSQVKPVLAKPAVAPAKPDASGKTYVVKPGDSLRQIAANLAAKSGAGVTDTMKKLASLNGITNPDALKAGMPLKLP